MSSLAVSPDGRYICVKGNVVFKYKTDDPTRMYLFDLKAGRVVSKYKFDDLSISNIVFTSNGKQIIATNKDGLYIVDFDSITKN